MKVLITMAALILSQYALAYDVISQVTTGSISKVEAAQNYHTSLNDISLPLVSVATIKLELSKCHSRILEKPKFVVDQDNGRMQIFINAVEGYDLDDKQCFRDNTRYFEVLIPHFQSADKIDLVFDKVQ